MDKIINLSIARKGVPILMDVVQGATAPNIVFVLDDYTPPGNARARIYIKKSNAEVYNSCTLSGNQITYTPTAGSFDEPGQCVAQLEIVQGNTVAISWRIFVTVEPNLIEGSAAPASTEYGALTDLIIDAQKYDVLIGANNIVGANNRQGWTALTSGQDLNTVLGVGMYYSTSGTITNSLLNKPPIATGFKMQVSYTANYTPMVTQTIYPASNSSPNGLHASQQTYTRQTYDGGVTWTDWILLPARDEVNAIANRGAKNLISTSGMARTHNGITYTRNDDGSITTSGTPTGNSFSNEASRIKLPKGAYLLTGCPSGGGTSKYRLYVARYSEDGTPLQYNINDTGNGVIISVTNDYEYIAMVIEIYNGNTDNDLTFYPMIRNASIQDDTYVPYGMSNAELTKLVLQLLNA